ncbi:MAG: aldehyde dehydrogenase family protein [Spongiibacteraceae bacterium]|nr:aldehyde dehydrogenase family protein [Spongiibacteraceae bacterium]
MTTSFPKISDSHIQDMFNRLQTQQWLTRQSSANTRLQKLKALRKAIKNHEEAICQALHDDLRKSPQAAKNDLYSSYADIDDAIAHLEQWMAPIEVERGPLFSSGKALITYEARGVVLLFGPWNFPFNLIIQPLVPIIAAGNCALVKPNEMAPHTSAVCSKIIKAVFSENEVAVFEGDAGLANRLLELPVDHIFFTGSPAIGKKVMAAAAKHLASVTLELGGKNPVIIDSSADIQKAAATIATYRNMNSGQLCLCPENVWIPESKLSEFLQTVAATYKKMFYKDGKLKPLACGKIIDQRNLARVKSYIDDAREQGATFICGGEVDTELMAIHPTLLVDVPANAKILQEEVFGPVLSVFTYKDINQVYTTLHQQAKPLALYIFSEEQRFIDQVLNNTTSGGVTINNCVMHCVEHHLPFGGVNQSGIGRYHGIHGFKELSHERAVLYPQRLAGDK